ncbi:MAG TPA: hypothetical protein VJ725_12065, partial [Thermoanaerobaculia bacterium]|nr:hypothetical protein [Thermoanaerobaculia bacterium]
MAVAVAGFFFVLSSSPAHAGCVSCGTDGECFDVSEGFSGNCACIIKTRGGLVICTPSGVCDPNQVNSCDENEPWVNASPGEEISAKFLSEIDAADPLLAAALSGAITEELSRSGLVVKRYLLTGEHTGTIAQRSGAGYRFTVQAEQIAQNAFSVAVAIEEEGTSRVSKYEGVIL